MGGWVPEVVVAEAGVDVEVVVLGVGHGLGVKGREVLARGHWRAEALHACDGCLCHSLFNNVLSPDLTFHTRSSLYSVGF